MPILKDYKQFQKCQDLFYRFVAILGDKIPHTHALAFLEKHRSFMNKEQELTDHIYQVALEATFHRKLVHNSNLHEFFAGQFLIVDAYKVNRGFSDMSTVNSLLLLERFDKMGYFKNQSKTAFSTPLEFHTEKYYKQQAQVAKEYVADSKAVTVNTNADVAIGHRIYDIKHTGSTPVGKSNIYPWPYEKVQANSESYLRSLLQNLNSRNESSLMHYKLKKTLEDLCNDNSKTWPEKNDLWNDFMQKNFDSIPKNYPLPIVIPMTNHTYTPKHAKSTLEKVRVSPDILDDHVKTRRAIAGICYTFGIQHIRRAAFITEGAISLDMANVKEELD